MTQTVDESDTSNWEVRRLSQDHPFPEEFTRAFGEVMIEFAILEGELFDQVNELASGNYFHGAILLAGVTYTGLVDRFSALVLHLCRDDEVLHEALDGLRRRLRDVGEHRNRLVHSTWLLEPIDGRVNRRKPSARGKKGLHFDTPTVPVDELVGLRRDIRAVRAELGGLGDHVFYRVYPPESRD